MWSRRINLVTRGLYPGDDALGVASQRASDAALGQAKRLFFTSPWRGLTIVGTTEHVYEGHPDAVAAPDDVVAGFLQEVSAAAPGFELQSERRLLCAPGFDAVGGIRVDEGKALAARGP